MSENEAPKGELVLQTLAMPADANSNGDIFGGWIMSQMDLGAGIAAKKRSRSRTVTVAVDAMVFRQPVHIGDTVHVHADITQVGNTSMKINIEVWAQCWESEKSWKVTEAIFTYVAVDSYGRPHAVDR
jgi:acyl-CoA thioesterase YciA